MSFPAYPSHKSVSHSWLGRIPDHWTVAQLKRLVTTDRPITYGIVQAGPHVPDGIPYIRPADMTDEGGVASSENILRTSREIALAYSRSTIRQGDLVCSIGPSFGKVMVTPVWLDGANLTQGTARIAIRHSHHSKFFFWALRSPNIYAQWDSSIGGATFRALNLGPLAESWIAVPPVVEQIAVARFLDRETAKIDALIAEQERLIEFLQEKRQAVISHAVTKGLIPNTPTKPSGVEWLGAVPVHWNAWKLSRAFRSIGSGTTPPSSETEWYEGGSIPWVRTGELRENVIMETSRCVTPDAVRRFSSLRVHPRDSLVVALYGATIGRVGILGVEAATNQACCVLADPEQLSVRFCFYWLQGFREQLIAWYATGGGQPNISQEVVASLRIDAPCIDEQNSISAFLDQETAKIDSLIAEVQTAAEVLKERRSALISAAVTGQIDVRGLVEQVAA